MHAMFLKIGKDEKNSDFSDVVRLVAYYIRTMACHARESAIDFDELTEEARWLFYFWLFPLGSADLKKTGWEIQESYIDICGSKENKLVQRTFASKQY